MRLAKCVEHGLCGQAKSYKLVPSLAYKTDYLFRAPLSSTNLVFAPNIWPVRRHNHLYAILSRTQIQTSSLLGVSGIDAELTKQLSTRASRTRHVSEVSICVLVNGDGFVPPSHPGVMNHDDLGWT